MGLSNKSFLIIIPLIILVIVESVFIICKTKAQCFDCENGEIQLDTSLFAASCRDMVLQSVANNKPEVINGTHFASFLYYSKNERDSVKVTPTPLAYYPYYHFIGFCIKNDYFLTFGYEDSAPRQIEAIKELIQTTYDINSDEKDYHDYFIELTNNIGFCGYITFSSFEVNLPPRPSEILSPTTKTSFNIFLP